MNSNCLLSIVKQIILFLSKRLVAASDSRRLCSDDEVAHFISIVALAVSNSTGLCFEGMEACLLSMQTLSASGLLTFSSNCMVTHLGFGLGLGLSLVFRALVHMACWPVHSACILSPLVSVE
jgi:hypothetical protein